MAATDYIDVRLRGMVAEAFGEDPLVEPRHYELFNRVYMAGPAFAHLGGDARRAALPLLRQRLLARTALPRDDRHYLYLGHREINHLHVTSVPPFRALPV